MGTSCSWPRVMSPTPGRSTLITSAPNHANNCVQVGPDCTCVKSRILTPSSALPSLPQGLVDILGVAALAGFRATTFSAGRAAGLAFTFVVPFVLAGAFVFAVFAFTAFFFAMVIPLLFLELALRIEIADAAALAAGGRIDRRVDEGGLA